MKRDDVRKQFPDATEDQIDAIMNQHNAEVQRAKRESEQFKSEAERLKAVEDELSQLRTVSAAAEEQRKQVLEAAQKAQKEFALKSNRMEAEKLFMGAGLTEADYKDLLDGGLITEDAETTTKLVNATVTMIKAQKASVDAAVRAELLKGTPAPSGGGTPPTSAITKEQFAKMSYSEMTQLQQSNPELFTQLTTQ